MTSSPVVPSLRESFLEISDGENPPCGYAIKGAAKLTASVLSIPEHTTKHQVSLLDRIEGTLNGSDNARRRKRERR